MIQDVYDSIKLSVMERVSSPFFGVFVISWLLFNWKVLAYFFWEDNLTIQERIQYHIQPLLDQSTNLIWFSVPDHILSPLCFTIVFSFIYPFISLVPYYVWQLATSWKHRIRNVFESQELLTVEQSNKLRTEMRQQQRLINEIVDESQTAKAEAENRLSVLEKELSDAKIKLSVFEDNKNAPETIKSAQDYYQDSLTELEKEQFKTPIPENSQKISELAKATTEYYRTSKEELDSKHNKSSKYKGALPPQEKLPPIKGVRAQVDIKPDGSFSVTSQEKHSTEKPVTSSVIKSTTINYDEPNKS